LERAFNFQSRYSGRGEIFGRLRHPKTLLDSMLTYPRYLGTIKPEFIRRSQAESEALLLLKSLKACWWPVVLECPVGKNVVVCSPHPDDESIGAGGFLLRHRAAASLHLICVFNGDKGGSVL